MILTDQKLLLEGLKNNNKEYIDIIYKSCFPLVKSYIVKNSGNIENAKDIFQEALIVLYQKVSLDDAFQLTCSISTYLYEVCKRLWLKHLNKNANNFNIDIQENEYFSNAVKNIDIDFEENEEFTQKLNYLKLALEKLGEPCTNLLKAFYNEDKKMSEICKLFNYTNEDTAKTQKYKCLMRLKKLFFEKFNPNHF